MILFVNLFYFFINNVDIFWIYVIDKEIEQVKNHEYAGEYDSLEDFRKDLYSLDEN